MDDNISREITLRIQKNDAYEDGNESSILENRQWRKSLPVDANGSVLLDLETSMELALLHSREFQQQKEALYLSALDVTYERFQLGPVPFAGVSGQVSQEVDEDASDFQSRAKAGFRGIAGKGTTWVASLANRLSIELSGGDVEFGGSLANLTITQPLLRGASRRIYLEQLTQSERTLLADARSLEQFRQGFFLNVVLGSNPAGSVGTKRGISPISPPSTGVSGFLGLVQELQRKRMWPNLTIAFYNWRRHLKRAGLATAYRWIKHGRHFLTDKADCWPRNHPLPIDWTVIRFFSGFHRIYRCG
jgi:hypothetical protein